ncbi:MAG: carboxypeptidase regulatory-like domain-containing protein, partial [Cytophagales bacterium]
MKQKLLFFLFLIYSHWGLSQISITGKVIDQSQNAIVGATLSITDGTNAQGTTTDSEGIFKLEIPQAGVYDVEVRFVGFDPYIKSFSFSAAKAYDLGIITLTEYTQELQTVEVSGRLDRDYTSDY